MSYQIIYHVFKINKAKVSLVLSDIEYFNVYVIKNGTLTDSLYFKNVLNHKHWRHLRKFSWLNNEQQKFLENGILSILLFMAYMILENQISINKSQIKSINRHLLLYVPVNKQSKKLHHFTINAYMKIIKGNATNNNEIMRYLSWTLDNIILKSKENVNE